MPTISRSDPHKYSYNMSRVWVNGKDRVTTRPFTFFQDRTLSYTQSGNPTRPTLFGSSGSGSQRTNPGPAKSWASLETEVYEKLREKFRNDVQIGTMIGEGKQTLQLVASLLGAARRPLVTLGKALKGASNRPLGSSADAWLGFQYGVRPLINEVYDTVALISDPFPRKRIRARSKDNGTMYAADPYTKTRWVKDVSVNGGFDVVITNPNMAALDQCGLINPASIAWELVPYSFVVDWFLPIGPWINSLSDYVGVDRANAWTTRFQRTLCTSSFRVGNSRKYEFVSESVYCERRAKPPSFTFPRVISLNWLESKVRVTSALALLTQGLRR